MIDISHQILSRYGRPEEYLIDHYPTNYFDYYIDIGTRGVKNPWHINNIAKTNPKTSCLGYEPDTPYYYELTNAIEKEQITNAIVHHQGFGTGAEIKTPQGSIGTVTLSQIFDKYNLNPSQTWAIKFDCEGGEYALFTEECRECVDILKQADHISLEFHTSKAGKNFFTTNNNLPQSFDRSEEWMKKNFTHFGVLTSKEQGLRTYVLLSDKLVAE